MKRSWFRVLLRRRLFVIFLLLLQVAFIIFVFKESYISGILQAVVSAISFLIAFYVISKKIKVLIRLRGYFFCFCFPYSAACFICSIIFRHLRESLVAKALGLMKRTGNITYCRGMHLMRQSAWYRSIFRRSVTCRNLPDILFMAVPGQSIFLQEKNFCRCFFRNSKKRKNIFSWNTLSFRKA